jgi:hypothetical protein
MTIAAIGDSSIKPVPQLHSEFLDGICRCIWMFTEVKQAVVNQHQCFSPQATKSGQRRAPLLLPTGVAYLYFLQEHISKGMFLPTNTGFFSKTTRHSLQIQ